MIATPARTLVPVLALLLAVCGTVLAQSPPPIHTNKSRFRIPFRSSDAEIRRLGATEVRLFVSRNGQGWRHEQSVAPTAGRFEFVADREGEFRFAVRTVDAGGGLHPPGPVDVPGLVVVVDARTPRIQVRLREPEPGRVELSWQIEDDNLDPKSLRLEYVQPGANRWQPVSVVPRRSGRTAWSTPGGGRVAVRGSVADHAGNVARAQHQLQVAPAADTVPRPTRPDFRQPIAGRMPSRFPRRDDGPNDDSQMPLIAPEGRAADEQRTLDGDLVSDDVARRPDVLSGRYEPEPEPRTSTDWTTIDRRSAAGRVVRALEFDVDYEIAEVGPSGLSAVEFYITTNDGGKWYRYGLDEDMQSPFRVRVPEDGRYGFALRARSGVGLAAAPPQPNEKPMVSVTVDRTPPRIRLAPPQQGSGDRVGEIVLHWRIEEPHPAPRAVALSYAAGPRGPWKAITDWTEDHGRYAWRIAPGMPSRFYVRLEARDAAGNVSRTQTPEPVLVDLARPKARIVDVQTSGAMQ